MEPIAPGTEDEPLMVNFSTSTKQEKERERLLNLKAVLPNGKYDNVFQFKYINGTEHWYCNACSCPVMGWVFHHESGKRHTMALGNQNQERFPSLAEVDDTPTIQIAPGEPVPPGFEGQIEKIALIQERLDVFNVGPLVALEYLLELRDYDPTKEPAYLCLLCDKKGDPRTVLTHLASYKHILQYLQKHFPTCYRALAPYMTKQYKRNWQIALHEIAEAIEKKFGRLKPMPVDADKYEKDPVQYIELIAKGRHFSELSGYTFENLVNKDELTKVHEDEPADKYGYNKANLPQPTQRKKSPSPPVVANPIKKIRNSGSAQSVSAAGSRRRSLSSVSSITSSDLSDFDEPKEKKNKMNKRSTRSKSPLIVNRAARSPHNRRYERRSPPPRKEPYYRRDERERERERDRERDRNLMPWEKSNYRRQKQQEMQNYQDRNAKNKNDKMEEYKKLCKAIDNDMDRILKNHKKNPEKHPQYNDEWKKFWNKRYKELQAEAKDVSTHDFKPEWIEFWNKRMIELHQDEVKVKKDALRKRLGLPEEPAPICFKILGKKKYEPNKSGSPAGNKPIPPSAMPDHDPEVIVIDDRDDDKVSGHQRSHSPWEDEPLRISREKSRDKSKSKDRERERSREISRPRSRDRRDRDRFSRSPRDRSRERSWDRDYKLKEYRRERIRIISELPWERERKSYRKEIPSYYKPPSVMRDVTREPVLSPTSVPVVEEEDDGNINVVSVLRLLTALEERLGSLGPKVIDLLGQALAMEKNEANSSENILDNDIYCVMFDTVKEKLKGQLLHGLVPPIQEKAFKNAIKKTASLVHMASERKKEKEKAQKVDPVKVPGVGTVDKAAIAKQIANALILQGKTDVTQAELEQLINAVVGMAEASRNSNKPITTANFLEQITKSSAVAAAAAATATTIQSQKEKTPPKEIPILAEETKSPISTPNKDMEGLSDSDLQTLLQNFKDLSTEEQHGLINYLKKLEAREPDRVERLRKFVNLGGKQQSEEKKSGRESPFSNRTGSVNPSVEENKRVVEKEHKVEETVIRLPIDSDEEDYTFEDVVKAASKNVKQKELEKEREIVEETMKHEAKKEELNLEDTRAIISNIMSNINKDQSSQPNTSNHNLLGFGNISVSSADLAKTLNSIPVNMASLANIVGSVQSLTNTKATIPAPTNTRSVEPPQGFGGYPPQQQQQPQFVPPPPQAYQPRPPNTSYGGVTYPPYQPNRSNVTYPVDKTKVSYPNYALYGQGGLQQEQRRNTNPQGYHPPGNQFGNNPNRNNTNYNNRW